MDLEQLLREQALARHVPSLSITIRPEAGPIVAAPSVAPPPSKQRALQAVIALGAGIAAAAIWTARAEPSNSLVIEPARPPRATQVTDVGALTAPAPIPPPIAAPTTVTAPTPAPARAPTRPASPALAPALAPAAVPEPDPSLTPPPTTSLSRDDVRRVMTSLRPALLTCAASSNGALDLSIVVHPSGRVQSTRVEGAFAGRPEGSCMARAARAARFPAFAGEAPATVRFPYSL